MRNLRRYVPLILVALSMLIDTSVIPMTGVPQLMEYLPMLTLMTVIALALQLGRTRGMLWGLASGLLMDIGVGYWFGLYSLVFVGIGYLAGLIGRKRQRHLMTTVVVAALGLMVHELVMILVFYLTSARMPVEMLRPALIRVASGTVLTQPLYLAYGKWTQAKWSKYAGR